MPSKIYSELYKKEEVIYIAQQCGITTDEVVGKLARFWCYVNEHGEAKTGELPNLSRSQLDRAFGIEGFAEALEKVGWIHTGITSVRIHKPGKYRIAQSKQTPPRTGNELFDRFWESYPARNGKKLGKGAMLLKFKALTPNDACDVLAALENYRASERAQAGYILDPLRFLARWREWIEPEVVPVVAGVIKLGEVEQ